MYLQHHCQLCYNDLGSTEGLFSYAWFGEFDIFFGIWISGVFAGSLLAMAWIEDFESISSTAFVIFFRMQCQLV